MKQLSCIQEHVVPGQGDKLLVPVCNTPWRLLAVNTYPMAGLLMCSPPCGTEDPWWTTDTFGRERWGIEERIECSIKERIKGQRVNPVQLQLVLNSPHLPRHTFAWMCIQRLYRACLQRRDARPISSLPVVALITSRPASPTVQFILKLGAFPGWRASALLIPERKKKKVSTRWKVYIQALYKVSSMS